MNFNKRIKQLFLLTLVVIFSAISFSNLLLLNIDKIEVLAWDGISFEMPEGLGTQQSPYLISTAEELFWVSNETNAGLVPANNYFVLTENINLSGYEWNPIGNYNSGDSSTAFRGNFNGAGFIIYNFKLEDSENANKYSGLFGYLDSATIQNLRIRQLSIELDLTTYEEEFYAGSLAGCAVNSTVTNISTAPSTSTSAASNIQINNSSTEAFLGGIIGYVESSDLSNLDNRTTITTSLATNVYAGGLVGKAYDSDIEKSYNKGSITVNSTATTFVGGLIGEANQTNLEKVFNMANISATSEVVAIGGLAGILTNEAALSSYTTKFAYNVGRVTLAGLNALESQLFLGGLFGRVEEKNFISYVYNASGVLVDEVASDEGLDVENEGTLIGKLELGSEITNAYYDSTLSNIGLLGIGIIDGDINDIGSLSTTNMRSKSSYDSGTEWNVDASGSVWAISGYVNNRYPILKNVGNYSVHAQVSGQGTLSPAAGIHFYELGTGRTYSINSHAGYQIKQIIDSTGILSQFSGEYNAIVNVNSSGMVIGDSLNLMVEFEPIPFTKTQMFYWLVGVGSLIIIMIVGTAIINYRYAIKMDKIIEEKKKTLNIEDKDKKAK